jgi:hypothetical protein
MNQDTKEALKDTGKVFFNAAVGGVCALLAFLYARHAVRQYDRKLSEPALSIYPGSAAARGEPTDGKKDK